MRKRNRTVSIRMTNEEYTQLLAKVKASGLTMQAYITGSSLTGRVSSTEEIDEIRNRNKILASIDTKLRGMGTNLNQMAHVANGHGVIPTASELVRISESVNLIRREVSEEWRSTRLLISHQNHTGQ